MSRPYALFITGTLFVFWLAWAFQIPLLESVGVKWDAQKFGPWGDTFGAFNALFGALGFGAVLWTLFLQQKQLRQNQYIQYLEQFDKSFFQLLSLLREARSQVRFRHSVAYAEEIETRREPQEGIPAFLAAWREVYVHIRLKSTTLKQAAEAYEAHVHRRYESTFGPYFRIFYTMLKRLHDDKILTNEDRIRYGNLLRGQITSYELAVAAMNGLSSISKDFDKLLTEFRFLKYLPGRRRVVLKRYYPEEAFAGRDENQPPKLFFRPISN